MKNPIKSIKNGDNTQGSSRFRNVLKYICVVNFLYFQTEDNHDNDVIHRPLNSNSTYM